MKKIIFSFLILFIPLVTRAQAQVRLDGVGYFMSLSYSQSENKKDGFVAGSYCYLGFGLNHSVESVIDHTKINYENDYAIDQWDATLIYTHYGLADNYRLGAHYLITDDPLTDHGIAIFGGMKHYVPYQWSAGLDGYVTFYGNYEPRLAVAQLTPQAGFYFARGINSGFYSEIKGFYIRLSDEVGLNKKDYFSIKETIRYYAGNLTLSVFGWAGEQAFAIQNDGMLLYNIAEKHIGGYGGYIRYVFAGSMSVQLGAQAEFFNDVGLKTEAVSRKAILSIGRTF